MILLPLLPLLFLSLISSITAQAPAPAVKDKEKGLPWPERPLVWGDVNVVSTTDIHGWLLGHQHSTWPEPNYSGDIGDVASFITHLRTEATKRGVDLLLLDSGDHHDGPGLVSSSPLGSDSADALLSQLSYSALAIGNHELYKYPDALSVYEGVQKGRWGGRYLTSNTNITLPTGESVPIGDRVVKFVTEQGRKVTAFGILYDFKASSLNLTNQAPKDLVKEPWFLEAIQELPDLFILTGHMPVSGRDSDFKLAFDAIRKIHPLVPVLISGGHSHIRDCVKLDGRSMSIQAGRYFETLSWVSMNLTSEKEGGDLAMSRRYLDNNRRTYKFHTNKFSDFDTPLGLSLTTSVNTLLHSLNLTQILGHAPQDYYMTRSPPDGKDSLYRLLMEDVLPGVITDEKVDKRVGKGRKVYLANSGCQRFDIFKGPFSRNEQLVVSPFTSPFVYFELPANTARNLLFEMNKAGATQLFPGDDNSGRGGKSSRREEEERVEREYAGWMREQWERYETEQGLRLRDGGQVVLGGRRGLTEGYVTVDGCGELGDDARHKPVRHAPTPIPDYVGTSLPVSVPDKETVLVILMDFFINDVVSATRKIDPFSRIREEDARPYAVGRRINDVWRLYAEEYW